MSEEIKQRIKCDLENVDHVVNHYEPQKKENITLSVSLSEDRRTIFENLGEAPFLRVLTQKTRDGGAIADSIMTNVKTKPKESKWLIGY